MRLQERKLSGVYEITSTAHEDFRGFMVRKVDLDTLKDWGLERHWVQESLSHTKKVHTVRGLHVQLPPYEEAKMISIVRGTSKWVVVDLRLDSDTFGQWDSVILSQELHNSLYVEQGFAHGCVSLSDGVDLLIHSDQRFTESHGTGIAWDDPDLGVDWGIGDAAVTISDRDGDYPSFNSFLENYRGL
jgi:dTDP-4-dehydrorhamnose 3,5-epimerase